MSEVEVVTQNLQGSCITLQNQVHGLFRLTRPRRAKPSEGASAYEAVASWDLRPVTRAVSSSV
jgi:hypothetical protein